jgi:hypothetical protein
MAKMSIIQIQGSYIARITAARQRWSHRPDGGHYERTRRAAHHEAMVRLYRWQITGRVAEQIIRDAADVAELQWLAEEEL